VEPEQPSPEHLLLLNKVYAVYRKDAAWPVYDYLDRLLDREFHVAISEVLESMPNGLLRVYTPIRDDTEIMLRVAGMLYCNNADGDVDLFMRALRWCVAKEASFEPTSPTASAQVTVPTVEVAEDWAKGGITSTPLDFEKLRCAFLCEWIDIAINGTPENWSWTIPKSIRRFRPVRNVYDYLRVIAEDKPQQVPASPLVQPVPGPTILVSPPQQVGVVDGGRAESKRPFGRTLDVASLHPLVRDACTELFAGAHYRQGVLDAALALRDLVREKSGLSETNDRTLISRALAGKNPRILVSDSPGDQGVNMREGTAYLALGIVARLRNVLTNEKVEVPAHEAMEMVAMISRVVRDVEAGRVADDESAGSVAGGAERSRPPV
jgi:uncharacterized protein (TIGR02391 family)